MPFDVDILQHLLKWKDNLLSVWLSQVSVLYLLNYAIFDYNDGWACGSLAIGGGADSVWSAYGSDFSRILLRG